MRTIKITSYPISCFDFTKLLKLKVIFLFAIQYIYILVSKLLAQGLILKEFDRY